MKIGKTKSIHVIADSCS